MKKIAIIMGSESDLPVMRQTAQALREFGLQYEIKIVSAHRTAKAMYEFARDAHQKFALIIAGAGGSAHLPGMVAALTPLPVIGVPIGTKALKGMDSLLSIVQMPKGVPVATVAIDGGYNAGLLAAKMLAPNDPTLLKKLISFAKGQEKKVQTMNRRLKKSRTK